MVKKILFISLALFGLLFSTMTKECFADASGQSITAIAPDPAGLVAHYEFEGDAGDTSQNVTASSEFFTDNDGSFNQNTLTAGSTPSESIGDYYVRAVYNGTSTENTGGDCELTVVKIEITDAPDYVLVYTGSEAGNQPTKTATAVGAPSGGDYYWTRTKNGDGDIQFMSGQTSSIVTIRGTAPSSDPLRDDVDLIVSYYGCEVSVALRVRRMSSTTCQPGDLDPGRFRCTRYFYHRIKDQFDDFIDETGIPCDENLRWKEGAPTPDPQSGETASHSSDGAWPGGIAVKDTVSYPTSAPLTNHGQDIDAGKWSTSPSYDIWIDISDKTTEQIWKDIE